MQNEVQRQLRHAFDSRLDADQGRALRRLSRAATAADTTLYLVGGAVRDLLLGRNLRDLDLAVEGSLSALLSHLTLPTIRHPGFGTATVEFARGVKIDLARTRKERYSHPAALPSVQPAAIETDLGRRDFTVNAMALRIERGRGDALLDPFNGYRDLQLRQLRVLHGASFIDDPTRGYRAIRLAAELGFKIERTSARALREAREAGHFEQLSAARLRREVIRILESPSSGEAIRLARRTHLLKTFVEKGGKHATRERVDWLTRRLRRFRRSNPGEPVCEWVSLIGLCMWPGSSPRYTIERLQPGRRQRLALEQLPGLVALARAIDASPTRPSRVVEACAALPTELLLLLSAVGSERRRRLVDRFLTRWRFVRADIDAQQLLDRAVPRGPRLAAGLKRALDAKLDGKARSARRQLEFALDDPENS